MHQKRNPAYAFGTNVIRWQPQMLYRLRVSNSELALMFIGIQTGLNTTSNSNRDLINESDINEIFLELKRTGIGIKKCAIKVWTD